MPSILDLPPLPEKPPSLVNEAVGTAVRKGLSALGGIGVLAPFVTPQLIDSLGGPVTMAAVGGVSFVWSLVWGLLNKKKLVSQIPGATK